MFNVSLQSDDVFSDDGDEDVDNLFPTDVDVPKSARSLMLTDMDVAKRLNGYSGVITYGQLRRFLQCSIFHKYLRKSQGRIMA